MCQAGAAKKDVVGLHLLEEEEKSPTHGVT